MMRLWRVYFLPAAVFQSVMIGGGYGTGREIVEYFTRFGILGGLLGLGLVTAAFALLLAVSYEFARVYQAYDYRRFFRSLLGRGWIAFEVLYLAMFALVLAVVAAAAGKLFEDQLRVPGMVGVGLLLLLVTVLAFYGRQWVTRILAFKAVLLSAVFLAYFLAVVTSSGHLIGAEFSRAQVLDGWAGAALRYTLYSTVVIPAMLFATTSIKSRGEAVASGVLTGVVGILPAVLLHLSFAAGYPEVVTRAIPLHWMISGLNYPALMIAYLLVLFGCLLDTGLCFIQSVNERLDGWNLESYRAPISRPRRAAVAILCVVVSGGLSLLGVVNLIARGYSAMAWGFFALYVAPLLTWGVYRLRAVKPAVAVAGVVVMSLYAGVGRTQAVLPEDAAASCVALKTADLSRVLDASTQITDARLVPATDRMRAYCEVIGSVAPSVGILVALPAVHWNHKLLEQGCGGFCGGDLAELAEKYGNYFLDDPLRRGYAVLMFDGGHASGGESALWAFNNLQAQFDFGVRAPHVAALAGKAVVARYYNQAPIKAYFTGCSSGGQQALSEAQRFPWDFDGILAGAPSPTFSGPMMDYLWAARALAGSVDQADLKLVHAHAVAKCDLDDGVQDGVIGDPLQCRFDPAELRCTSGQKTAECLTASQVEAVKRVYSGPATSKGEKLTTGGPLPGSELNWITDELSGAYISGGAPEPWPKEYFAYVGFMPAPGPSWMPAEFDFDRDYKRLRMAESLFGAADNPDLRRFNAAGGKLILYQGGQDQSDVPTDSIDYYETTQKTVGGRAATQEFFRLFLVPGMNHCSGGPGASTVDYLSYLEAWVEKGQAPDVMIGSHTEGDPSSPKTIFTRPIYPYPARAKYKGRGDPNDASSFAPVGGKE